MLSSSELLASARRFVWRNESSAGIVGWAKCNFLILWPDYEYRGVSRHSDVHEAHFLSLT